MAQEDEPAPAPAASPVAATSGAAENDAAAPAVDPAAMQGEVVNGIQRYSLPTLLAMRALSKELPPDLTRESIGAIYVPHDRQQQQQQQQQQHSDRGGRDGGDRGGGFRDRGDRAGREGRGFGQFQDDRGGRRSRADHGGNNEHRDFEKRRQRAANRPTTYTRPQWATVSGDDTYKKTMNKARLTLNKLTVEKFERLSDEFLNTGFTTEELLAGAIDLIVDKAQLESHFVQMYADLCLKLAITPIEALGDDGKGKRFKKLLLNRCQIEFERDQQALIKELDEIEDVEEKEEKILILRKRYLGHMQFVGQLYRVELLSEKIIHMCIQELFGDTANPDEEKLNCLCTLLTTVGKRLEEDASKKEGSKYAKYMRKYLKELTNLSKDQALSSRVKFMIKDLLEMRAKNWTARRVTETAKTIAEIHDDAAMEEMVKSGQRPKAGTPRSSSSRGGSGDVRRGGGSSSRGATSVSTDGWETVKGGTRRVGGAAATDEWTTPANSRSMSGRSGQRSPPASSSGSSSSRGGGGGMFSALQDAGKKKKKKDKSEEKPKKKKDKKEKSSTSNGDDTAAAPAPPPAAAPSSAAAAEPAPAAGPALTEDKFRSKVKDVLAEFMELKDFKELSECFQEMDQPQFRWRLVSEACDLCFSHKAAPAALLGGAVVQLCDAGLLTAQDVEQGFFDVLEFLTDVMIDVPKAGELMASLMAPAVLAAKLPLSSFARAPEGYWGAENDKGGAVFAVQLLATVKDLAGDEGDAKVAELVQASPEFDLPALAKNGEDVPALLAEAAVTLP